MNREETLRILAVIKINYTNFCKDMGDMELEALTNLWLDNFKELPYKIVDKAVGKYIRTNTYPPTIANILNMVKEIAGGVELSTDDAYNLFITNIRKYGYNNWSDAYKDFNNEIKRAITDIGGWIWCCQSTDAQLIERQFKNAYNMVKNNIQVEATKQLSLNSNKNCELIRTNV